MKASGLTRKVLCCACSAAVAASMAVPAGTAFAAGSAAKNLTPQGGITWADDNEDVLLVTGTDGLEQFAQSVEAGNTYEGKTVKLVSDLDFESYGSEWKPIGSKAHPFCGTFAGYSASGSHDREQTRTIANLKVSGSSYLGLFGYVGVGGSICNIKLEGASITAESSTDVIKNVGSLAGYVYGAIGDDKQAIYNCSSDAVITVTSALKADEKKNTKNNAPDADIESGYTDDYKSFGYIGGLVGYCAGSIAKSSFGGSLTVTSHESPVDTTGGIGKSIGGVAGQVGGYTVNDEIKKDEEIAIKPCYPTATGGDTTTPDAVSRIDSCNNSGTITVKVDGEGELDRFGEQTAANVLSVGGVAGYAMANVDSCKNAGKIDAGNANGAGGGDGVGGIVGNLRSLVYSGSSSADCDAGSYKAPKADESTRLNGPELTVSNCTNSAQIIGLHAPGGIIGGGGTRTKVTMCANLKGADIAGVRWNKPMVGGIAGQMYGDISYCYNRGDVSSKVDGTGGGFYVAGIVGCVARFEASDSNAETFNSPEAQVYSCFSSGAVLAGGSYKQAGICGENEGYIHDCYYLYDQVSSNDVISKDDEQKVSVAENFGTVAKDTVVGIKSDESGLTASEKLKSKEYVAKLNATVGVDGYEAGTYFVPASSEDQNDGYAVFASQRAAGSRISESGLSAQGTGEAVYSATANPLPALKVSYNGKQLVEGADYYAVPDADALDASGKCKDVADLDGTTLRAQIVGIGDYSTGGKATSWSTGYTLAKAKFTDCTVAIKSKTFNYLAQYPATPTDGDDSEVKIMDASGARVPASSFSMEADQGKCITYHKSTPDETKQNDDKSYAGYRIKFTANKDSNYEGDVYGIFAITKAHLIDSDCAKIESVSWKNQKWLFKWEPVTSSSKAKTGPYRVVNGKNVEGMTITYCGESIKPKIGGYKYKDGNGTYHDLEEGKDYKVVYGDPGDANQLISVDASEPNVNVGSKDSSIGSRPCMTIRFVPGNACNFQNYHNVFFTIAKADIKKDCKVSIPSSVKYGDVDKITVKSYTGKKLPNSDYKVTMKAASGGKVKVTLTGTGNVKGSMTKTVKLKSGVAAGAASKVSKVKVAKKKATVSWPAVSCATGYQLSYKAQGTSKWKTAKAKKNSTTLKKLTSGKKYQVKVKAYVTYKGKTAWGKESKVTTTAKIK